MLGGVRGGLMAEEYRQLTDGQKMLRYFYEELEAAFERGEPDLILQISRVPGEAGVYILPVTTASLKNVSEELELGSGARAVSLLRRLDDEGYLRLNYGSSGPHVDIPTPTMEYIPDRGLFEIGELPHPDERFAAAIQRTRDAVEQSDLPEDQKGSVLETLDKTITVLRTAHGLGDLIQKAWSS
jgi:hypothetical protein